ncbi:hypothetical protein SAMN05421827_102293 [Pedobacter terrae]|uniref:Lipocalin-like domain-containing protein n=1 Tax=Pedobacter terrae TaxID=405671 RepID=A0A1G7QJ24_9SPHI|nr:hypothetical protein [Pedobacter terrae]SDF97620.1 hypothetical protein SAMN05421827_102293 [Pedobacter terrae]
MRKILLLLALVGIINGSCKKSDDRPGEVYGEWKLTETLADIGNGQGKYKKVTGEAKYLKVERSGDQVGRFTGNAMPNLLSFKILDSVRMEVYSSNYQMPAIFRYQVSAKSLELNPPCIEGCGYRFVRK